MDEYNPQFNTQKNDTAGSNPPVYGAAGGDRQFTNKLCHIYSLRLYS